jgi:hypothetical protein
MTTAPDDEFIARLRAEFAALRRSVEQDADLRARFDAATSLAELHAVQAEARALFDRRVKALRARFIAVIARPGRA